MISYTNGNILHDQADAIINPVNTVGVMGKGLALQFKNAFPDNFKAHKSACDSKELTTGKMLTVATQSVLPSTSSTFQPKFIGEESLKLNTSKTV
ncbi:macro domain-containing protein [Vibrio sagamiensis]|uniref:Macro domain-containing protein n=1 Tax=Vibrio sagamiensis NBRC 104589 TaxID=1219064 RepID=A0A511QEP2_9VIBR|nr:macro domain-containing protein [Vibrio sagamiensis]GEM75657.1 hypothetical protein VSA01S_17690 [Vibrio sagamiensis NBRC 104589]